MKTNNIIKLTLEVNNFANNNNQSANVFIEGLCFNFKRTDNNYDFCVTASNEDWSLRKAIALFNTDFSMTNQIRNLIDQVDDIVESHARIKRLRKVTNQQA